jgi:O-antigen/teichoic acid export membrane protein
MNSLSPPSEIAVEHEAFWHRAAWWRKTGKTTVLLWITAPLMLAGTVVAARALGPADYGAVVLALSAVTLLATFLDVSLEEGVVHHGFKALATGDVGRLRALLRTALVLDCAIGVAVAGAIVLAAGPVARVISGGRLDPVLIRVAALSVLAATANGVTGGVLLLKRRPDVRALVMAWTALVRLATVVLAVSVGGTVAVLTAFAVASAVGGATQAVVAWRVGWRHWMRSPAAPDVSARTLVGFAVHSSVTTSVIAVKEAVVSLFLGRAAGPAAVGTLHVAMLPVMAAAVGTAPVRLALFPEQARLHSEDRTSQLRRSIRAYTTAGFLLGVVAAVAGWFLLPVIVPLVYSQDFQAAVLPARILLVAGVAMMAVGWAKSLPAAIGRPGVRTVVSLVELALTFGLALVLVRHGPAGAAVAISATGVVAAAVWMYLGRSLLGRKDRDEAVKGQPPAAHRRSSSDDAEWRDRSS